MDLLVTYDIGDTQGAGAKRLRAVHDLCCEYGQRVQLSRVPAHTRKVRSPTTRA